MQEINKIMLTFPEILAICSFKKIWACWTITQLKQHDKTVVSIDV